SVRFIKLDVEGSEIRAIQGMPRLLERKDAPAILFESNRHTLAFYGETPENLKAELRRLGYTIYHLQPGLLVPAAETEQQALTEDYLAAKRLPPALRMWHVHSISHRLKRLTGRVRGRVGSYLRRAHP